MDQARLDEIKQKAIERVAQNDRNCDADAEPWGLILELVEHISHQSQS